MSSLNTTVIVSLAAPSMASPATVLAAGLVLSVDVMATAAGLPPMTLPATSSMAAAGVIV